MLEPCDVVLRLERVQLHAPLARVDMSHALHVRWRQGHVVQRLVRLDLLDLRADLGARVAMRRDAGELDTCGTHGGQPVAGLC